MAKKKKLKKKLKKEGPQAPEPRPRGYEAARARLCERFWPAVRATLLRGGHGQ